MRTGRATAFLFAILFIFTTLFSQIIFVNAENSGEETFGLSIKMPEERDLRIAQFADLHFGTVGKDYHNDKPERTEEYMRYIAENGKPDLIVCSGDNILSTGVSGLSEFIELMESLETPWTFLYGNHDAEYMTAGYSKRELNDYLLSCGAEYLLYGNSYDEPSENRYGNFSISVLSSDGSKLLGALIILDSGKYMSDIKSYQSITTGQIAWYEGEIDRLQAIYSVQSGNYYSVVPSIVFAHIQLPEFHLAYKSAVNGDGAEFVIRQDLNETHIKDVETGAPTNINTHFYDSIVAKGSTKAYFVGHAHIYNWQVRTEDGVIFGFAPQTGFSKLFEDNDLARDTYIYSLAPNFTFTTESIKENAGSLGLAYSGTYDGIADYNEATGKYTVFADFELWNRLMFSYNGERITTSNTTVTGYYVSGGAPWNEYLYSSDGKSFIYSSSRKRTYIFTYDPAASTLNIDIKPDEPVKDGTITPTKVNIDSGADSISVWTDAGTKIRTATSDTGYTWLGNGWRYYIVIDGEGRIAYSVKYPLNGYGGPTGTGYYVNGYYTSYTENPVFNFVGSNWEVIIPEGGFAITAHGSAVTDIVNALSDGSIDDISDAKINKRGVYDDDLRLSYDSEKNIINITRAVHVHTAGEWVTVKEAEIGIEGLEELRCTECGEVVETRVIPAIEPQYILGDINGDGGVSARDYIMLKRYCLGTYELDEEQLTVADINGDGKVGSRDYILLKRHCLGTYDIFAN